MSCYEEDLLQSKEKFEERCPVCVHKDDGYEDPKTCGTCFGVDKHGNRYQYKNFKKEK